MLFYIRKIFSFISIFFIKGSLSDKNIKRLLGSHIFIYPFKEENLKPASYNLTASKCAFIKEGKVQKLIVKDDCIIIPPGKTGIIETEESLYVSKWICGTYHSRVKLVNKGLGHIGTTLDPDFFGVSAIALHNTTQKEISIKVGEPIVTVMFSVLKSRSIGFHDNMSGRVDDNISFDVNEFYDQSKCKEVITVFKDKIKVTDGINEEFIKDSVKRLKEDGYTDNDIIAIYDLEKVVCNNCINCNNNSTCSYKLLKQILSEEDKKNNIIQEINLWKSKPWRVSKGHLINLVQAEVKNKNVNKDIVIYSVIWILIGFGIIGFMLNLISKETSKSLTDAYKIIIGVIIPTVTIIIGKICNYKKNKKE